MTKHRGLSHRYQFSCHPIVGLNRKKDEEFSGLYSLWTGTILAGAALGTAIVGTSRLTEHCQGSVQSLQGMLDLMGLPSLCSALPVLIHSRTFVGGIQA